MCQAQGKANNVEDEKDDRKEENRELFGILQLSQWMKKPHKTPPLTANGSEMCVEVDTGATPLPARSGTSYSTNCDFKLQINS